MSKVSIIIPVYNVEKYLERCLDSVINQTYKNLEIICVNDCSPDSCAKILEVYSKKDERIKIINRKKNGGLSAARNTGLDCAEGEYIYFLDSDDWIDPDYIKQMVDIAQKYDCDIVQNLNILEEFEEGNSRIYNVINLKEAMIEPLEAINNTPVMTWSHLFKKEFLDKNNLKFPEGYIHEDIYFHHITKSKADKMYVFQGDSYHYFQRSNSIISSRKSRIIPMLKVADRILNYYLTNEIKNKDKISLLNFSDISEITTQEDYTQSKIFLNKLLEYYKTVDYTLSDFENFVHDVIFKTNSFEEYYKKYGANLRLSYLRYIHTRERERERELRALNYNIITVSFEKTFKEAA